MASSTISYHLNVVGKWQSPDFHRYRVASEYLSKNIPNVRCTIEGYFEAQYESRLKTIISEYGNSFYQARPGAGAIVYCLTSDMQVLYFANADRFFEWAEKRFKYVDTTSLALYKRTANKTLAQRYRSDRNYVSVTFYLSNTKDEETVIFELFTNDCPKVCENFMALLKDGKYLNSPVHRVKEGMFLQAGDIVDGSGMNSVSSTGNPVPDDCFKYKHNASGLLGMCSKKLDMNGSQFYITLSTSLPSFDGQAGCIFGRVISGMRTIWKIGKCAKNYCGRPIQPISIVACKANALESGDGSVVRSQTVTGLEMDMDINMEGVEENQAATKLQARFRGKQSRRAVQERREEVQAATKVQTLFRGKKARQEVLHKKEEKAAAIKVQSMYRGNLTRKNMKNKVEYKSTDANA